jgi:hypothetical protein
MPDLIAFVFPRRKSYQYRAGVLHVQILYFKLSVGPCTDKEPASFIRPVGNSSKGTDERGVVTKTRLGVGIKTERTTN